jgi:hypothetical protein
MPLATKNNALILKDGSIAENCECCGRYRYRCDARDNCPCRYAKDMPATLTADLTFDIGSTVYGFAVLANLFTDTTYLGCTKLTKSQAAARDGTYTLVRETGILPSEFFFSPRNGSLCSYGVDTGDVTIRVSVGAGCGATNSGKATLSNISLELNVPAAVTDTFEIPFRVSDFCSAETTNAAGRSFVGDMQISLSLRNRESLRCIKPSGEFSMYDKRMQIDSSPAGFDGPQCEAAPIKKIDHTWKYDVLYTDTSGGSVALGRVSRALTLRVRDLS